jgi:2'-5' RNA ligase
MWYRVSGKKKHDNVMIAFYLPKKIAKDLVIKNKDVPKDLGVDLSTHDEMHLTLVLLDDAKSLTPKLPLVQSCLEQIASEYSAIAGKVGGLGVFTPDGNHDDTEIPNPIYYSFDAPGLSEFRNDLTTRLKNLGLPVNEQHGYTPHITIGYTESGTKGSEVLPHIEFTPVEVNFEEVHLKWGDVSKGVFRFQKD